jgi:sugar phosphate permease
VCRVPFVTLVTVLFLFAQAVRVMVDYWLSVWVDREYHLSTKIYVISYACFAAGAIVLSLSRALMFTEAAILSAKQMHGRMAERVLRSPQLFFDQVFSVHLTLRALGMQDRSTCS